MTNVNDDKKKGGGLWDTMSGLRTWVYVGETKRALERRIVECKQAVKKFDEKNGVAVHANTHNHHINREEAKMVTVEHSFWRRRVQDTIRIRTQDSSMNLDCGLFLSRLWDPVLPTWLTFFIISIFSFYVLSIRIFRYLYNCMFLSIIHVISIAIS